MTSTRKNYKSLAAFALALLAVVALVIAPACSCTSYGDHKVFDYDSIVFQEVDEGKLAEDIAYARSKIGGNVLAISGALDRVVSTINAIANNHSYTYLEYLKDSKGAYKEKYTRYDAMYTNAYKQYMDLLYDVLQAHPEAFDEETKQIVLSNHETMDDEFLTLQNEITALENEYNALAPNGDYEVYADSAAEILVQLVGKYNTIAAKSGHENYIELGYSNSGRSYGAKEAEEMCAYVKEYISPLLDVAVTEVNNASKKLTNSIQLQNAVNGEDEISRNYGQVEAHTKEIGGYMSEALSYMGECNLLYKATAQKNPNAIDGALTTYLSGYNAPYIYQYCTGGYNDLMTFVHEFGHFTAFYNHGAGGSADLDIAEIHSQANEMLFMPRLLDIYGSDVGQYLIKNELFNSLYWSVTMGCLLDEFQREIYSDPITYSTADAINGLFNTLMIEYNADGYGEQIAESAGYDFNNYWWAAVGHTFTSPFYYISYAMSAIPSLTIYEDSQSTSVKDAITEYNVIQSYGDGSYTFVELLAKANVASPFERSTYRSLSTFLTRQFTA